MHDGSIATLEGVLDHYAAGGRAHNNSTPDNPNKDPLVGGFELSAVTDDAVPHDARYGNPWAGSR